MHQRSINLRESVERLVRKIAQQVKVAKDRERRR